MATLTQVKKSLKYILEAKPPKEAVREISTSTLALNNANSANNLNLGLYLLNHSDFMAINCQTLAIGTSLPHWLIAALLMPSMLARALAEPAF